MNFEILEDGEVLRRLADDTFRQDWQSLYERCPWATGYQSLQYVTCWYQLYETRYRPIVLAASAADGRLVGVLALALDAHARALVGAGGEDTVYQVWLATPEGSDAFMQGALSLLRKRFRRYHLHLKHLPAATPLDGLRTNAGLVKCTFSTPEPRPYMRTDAERIVKSFKRCLRRHCCFWPQRCCTASPASIKPYAIPWKASRCSRCSGWRCAIRDTRCSAA